MSTRTIRVAAFAVIMVAASAAHAELSSEELAKIAQNPVGNLISVPFQENLNLNTGPLEKNYNLLNIQPVIPIDVNEDWNIITRTILPVISLPPFAPGQNRTNGIGDLQFTAFLSPAKPGSWIWGVGAITQQPTHSDPLLGNNNSGYGPSFVVLHLEKGSPWVYGVLANNVWSSNNSTSPSYNNGLIQPFLNYNFKSGMYLTSSPVITVNWQVKEQRTGTATLGAGYSGGLTGTGLTGTLSYQENNINGTGNGASVRLERGTRVSDAQLSVTMPYVGKTEQSQRYSFGATLFTQQQTNFYPVYAACTAAAAAAALTRSPQATATPAQSLLTPASLPAQKSGLSVCGRSAPSWLWNPNVPSAQTTSGNPSRSRK